MHELVFTCDAPAAAMRRLGHGKNNLSTHLNERPGLMWSGDVFNGEERTDNSRSVNGLGETQTGSTREAPKYLNATLYFACSRVD